MSQHHKELKLGKLPEQKFLRQSRILTKKAAQGAAYSTCFLSGKPGFSNSRNPLIRPLQPLHTSLLLIPLPACPPGIRQTSSDGR